jgi:hypothetical protein
MAISKEEGQRLNRMSTLQRLTELLDHPVKYKDILRNNLNVLFPIAEEQAAFWEKTSNQIKRKYPNLKDDDSSLAYVEQEALEWNKIARRCCLEVLKIEPNKAMRVKWGVAFLVGYVFINDSHGRICNIKGGHWVFPKQGYYTKEEATAMMDMRKAEMDRFAIAKLPPPCKVVPV